MKWRLQLRLFNCLFIGLKITEKDSHTITSKRSEIMSPNLKRATTGTVRIKRRKLIGSLKTVSDWLLMNLVKDTLKTLHIATRKNFMAVSFEIKTFRFPGTIIFLACKNIFKTWALIK